MASIGRVLVGAAVSKAYRTHRHPRWSALPAVTIWAALALLPDAAVLGFRFGVHDADPWGHRGATHSFAFARMVAARAAMAVSDPRFFAPWRPIPVAPIGRAFLRARGLRIAVTEVAAMAPFLIHTPWPRRRRIEARGSSQACPRSA